MTLCRGCAGCNGCSNKRSAVSMIGTDRPVCVIGTIRLGVPIIPIRVRFPVIRVVRVMLIIPVDRTLFVATVTSCMAPTIGCDDFDASAFFRILLDFSRGAGILE